MTKTKIAKITFLALPTLVAAAALVVATENASAVTTRAFVLESAEDLAAGELVADGQDLGKHGACYRMRASGPA